MYRSFAEIDPSVFMGDCGAGRRSENMSFNPEDIFSLRSNHPEFSRWSNEQIAAAFREFSNDVLEVPWAEWLLDRRSDLFLSDCHWKQKHRHAGVEDPRGGLWRGTSWGIGTCLSQAPRLPGQSCGLRANRSAM